MSDDRDLAAGEFSSWLLEIRGAIREQRDSAVPCNGCTACCRSSQFVHIGPDERDTLARIPSELLFPAPGRPRGHVVLGYDERGHCPMLIDDKCSIYDHRPQTCRAYDCRIFAASGIDADPEKVEITRRTRRWQFGFSTDDDRTRHLAVQAGASYLAAHPVLLRNAGIPANQTQIAALAVEIHDVFLVRDKETGCLTVIEPEMRAVEAALSKRP